MLGEDKYPLFNGLPTGQVGSNQKEVGEDPSSRLFLPLAGSVSPRPLNAMLSASLKELETSGMILKSLGFRVEQALVQILLDV